MIVGDVIRDPKSMHWIGPFTILFALFNFAGGLWSGGKSAYLLSEGTRTTATVVSVDLTSEGAGTPVVEFTTQTGLRVRRKGNVNSKPPQYRVGDAVDVYYLASDPELASIATFPEMWSMPTLFLFLGVGFAALGVGFWVVGSRRKRGRERARGGLHLPGLVVGSTPLRSKHSMRYVPIVEVRHPQTGQVIRAIADPQDVDPQPGAPAVMHVDPAPPHGYVVELTR